MINFWLPSPAITSVTTARQSQYGNVMISPVSLSAGNRIYLLTSARFEPYLHQWHCGGVERVPLHRSVTGNTALEPHESDAGTAPETREPETATTEEVLSHTQGVAAQNRILTQNQSEHVQARSGKEKDSSIAADFGVSQTKIQRRMNTREIAARKPYKLYNTLTQSQLDRIQARLGKEPDSSIAADFELSENTIRRRRRTQGIPAFQPHKLNGTLTKSQLDRIQARLGIEPDAGIAADFGVNKSTIRKRRNAQGIAAYESRKIYNKLTQSQLDSIQARLGSETDVSIAADFELSDATIRRRRHALGIAAYNSRQLPKKLTQSQSENVQARLGKETDACIAADFGVNKTTIQKRRSAQGIPAFQPHKPSIYLTQSQSERVQARLGKETDARIAADFGVSESVIRSRRSAQGIASYRPHKSYIRLTQSQSERVQARLGKESDANIAADFEVSRTAIQARRSAQGIAAFRPNKLHVKLTQSQSERVQARLGREPDGDIAADFGVSEASIQKRRNAQGIPACQPRKSSKKLTQSQPIRQHSGTFRERV